MFLTEFFGALFIAMLIGLLFYFAFRRTGPWGSFWSFFLVLFLGLWMVSIWMDPIGPSYWDVAWLDFIFIGLIFALLMAAATPRDLYVRRTNPEAFAEGAVAIGIFFWLLIIMLIAAIIIGLVI
ncbi:hypothetical protein ACKGJO_08850 [Gracilimonas sp. Q87]|uniref:hypothetical protein n=1 Tax=Gracilimonas sp. Q87 TaxID=3384766 RepID=UPI0039844142